MEVGKATPRSIFFLTFLYMLPVCLHNKNNTHHITRGNNQHNQTTSLLNKNKEFNANQKKTYSLMYESPISQTSTILAFGLHSDITSCKASAKFRKINIISHKLTNDRHKSRLYHSQNQHLVHSINYHIYNYHILTCMYAMKSEKITVNNLSGTLVFGDHFWRGEIQLLLLPLVVGRHGFKASKTVRF